MRRLAKLSITVLTALIALSLTAGAAGARVRIEINATAFLASGRFTFGPGTGTEVICDVTLHITALTRLISKVRGSLVGRVSAILTANPSPAGAGCAALLSLPMLVFFDSITGRLPTITGGRLAVFGGFLIRLPTPFGLVACLYLGTILGTARENPVLRMEAFGERIRLFDASLSDIPGLCPAEGSLASNPVVITPELTIRLLER